MTSKTAATGSGSHWDDTAFKRRLRRRRAAEKRFKWYGIGAVLLGIFFVFVLFFSIAVNGVGAFWQTQIQLDIYFDPAEISEANLYSALLVKRYMPFFMKGFLLYAFLKKWSMPVSRIEPR